jgi:Fur family transcriptional regulator, ferric uptake regulator
MSARSATARQPWADVRSRLRERGLRWTPQRRLLIEVMAETDGHITATELVERCRAADPETTPSTVYRSLDVLEELGLIRHCHGIDGREEFHVLPEREHGHLFCATCGRSWDIEGDEAAGLVHALRRERGFRVDLSHLSVVGVCAECATRRDDDLDTTPARAKTAPS